MTWDNFTNLYSLSKTLRFELKPVGETLKNMKEHLKYDENLKTFLKDQDIEDAYQALKPAIDTIHKDFITQSLESDEAKKIGFSEYLEAYKEKKEDKGERKLREKIGGLYKNGGIEIKRKYKIGWKWNKKTSSVDKEYPLEWKVGGKIKEGAEIMKSPDIVYAAVSNAGNIEEKHLKSLEGFFTYFQGFNQNRENYYETKDEKTTAVATRIVHENLPKFCDNLLAFEKRKNEYLGAYEFLKSKNVNLVDKEEKLLSPISENIFDISYFPYCLSQREIEQYNAQIGNANFLINLCNQQQKEKSSKLPKFKTLYKQIGCGEKRALFFALSHNTKKEAEENKENHREPYSAEQVLEDAQKAGEKYFQRQELSSGFEEHEEIETIPEFLDYILEKENYEGVYWSKAGLNTISNRYFENWHSLKDRLKAEKVFQKSNKEGEDVKIPEVIELSNLFAVFDITENWRTSFFKESLAKTEGVQEADERRKRNKRQEIINESQSPSEALLKMIFEDMRENMQSFLETANSILENREYQEEENKKKIKAWMDCAKYTLQMLKYFQIRENKIKKGGNSLDTNISNALKLFLFEAKLNDGTEINWFKWYDALRNYLTKKPQDDAKENKLKLNFECPSLLGGWSDGQEKVKKSVILTKDGLLYLGILKQRSIFDTGKESAIYNENGSAGRLILANLKFQTLAGKGFLGEFGESYGTMGGREPLKAITCLQKIIKDRYAGKYPLLKRIAESSYADKKAFDMDIQETLKECYVCEFSPIDWEEVFRQVSEGNLYVFEITNKKSNIQNIYWKEVFQRESPHQLNGGGEVFYRKQAIKDKKVKKGYEKKPWVIEGKRFTENKELERSEEVSVFDGKSFFFHCPIKLNYKAKSYGKPEYAIGEINNGVNETFFPQEDIYFLGLDRGEKHLVYYSLVDKDGNIIKQDTFNLPFKDKNGNPRSIKKEKYFQNKQTGEWEKKEVDCWDYNDLLDAAASNRDEARKNWQTIGNIKNLKEGYISQVVHEICKIIQDKPTYIVLEDLNTGFKRGRQKIERQVYQKFELALAKKLNFLVNKVANDGDIGSVTKALQFTPPVQNYGDIENRKQVGIMLYTRANYTSQTDPLTGWRKTIYLKSGPNETTYAKDGKVKNKSVRDQIGEKFDDIGFENGHYFFEYSYGEIIDNKTGEVLQKKWRLWSGYDGKQLLRYRGKRNDKNIWTTKEIEIEKILDDLFTDFDKDRSLYSQIFDEEKKLSKIDGHTAWDSLRFVIDVIQQIRNSGDTSKGEPDNFLLSPVRNEKGEHFDSRNYEKQENSEYPKDADANGAYNIARKGILMNAHIQNWIERGSPKNKEGSDLDLFISDKEWDLFLSDYDVWEKQLSEFSSRKAREQRDKKKK